jgi:hypothetical protein
MNGHASTSATGGNTMSSTNFWFDRHGNCKNPGQAIAYLQDTQSRTYLSDFWSGFQIPRSIDLQNQALLMMGITDNLQAALLRDYNNGNGIGAVQTAGPGSLKIAYVRRRAGIETKSVVIIADFNLYWVGQYTNWGGQTGWIDMYPGYNQAISIDTLARNVIPIGSGKTAQW